MSQNLAAEDIVKQLAMDGTSDGVKRLTESLACQGSSTDDIAKIINQDKNLIARVLRAANPRAEEECDYTITTIDAALMRCGVGSALLMAMTAPLIGAITKTFQTMLVRPLDLVSPRLLDPFDAEHLVAEVGFDGKAAGVVQIRLESETARILGGAMVGLAPDEFTDEGELKDVLGEMANIIAGNFKSNLCDAGLTCKLSPPKIEMTDNFKLRPLEGGLAERNGFRSADVAFFVDVCVNPWS